MTSLNTYVTVDEFRYETNVQSGEWNDHKIESFLKSATKEIDLRTGRTWKGIQTVTDEYYDGDGKLHLYLNQRDIVSITALSIDDDLDGTFTSVTPSYVRIYADIGRIELDVETKSSLIEVNYFSKGPQNVKVSYTYGVSEPTCDIRELCIMMVQYRLNPVPELKEEIDFRFKRIRINDIAIL